MEKKSYHHGNLKNALVEAGIALIIDKGVENLSIRNVVNMIGVSHTAPYRHIKNKEELIIAIAIRGFELLEEKMKGVMNEAELDDYGRLVQLGKNYIRFAIENREYFRIMFGPYIKNKTAHADLFAAYNSSFVLLLYAVKKCLGEKKKSLKITALAVWSLVHGYTNLVIDNEPDRAVGSDYQIDLVMKQLLLLVQ